MKILTDAAGTQSVSVDDLEQDPNVSLTVKRLHEGFVAEQVYRKALLVSDTQFAAVSEDPHDKTSATAAERAQQRESSTNEMPKKHRQAGENASED
jgi:hypothetical protein